MINDLQSNVARVQYRTEVHRIPYEGELAHLTTVTYRCLSRIHQVLIEPIPHIFLSAEGHADLSQLTYELLRFIYELQKSRDAPKSPAKLQ